MRPPGSTASALRRVIAGTLIHRGSSGDLHRPVDCQRRPGQQRARHRDDHVDERDAGRQCGPGSARRAGEFDGDTRRVRIIRCRRPATHTTRGRSEQTGRQRGAAQFPTAVSPTFTADLAGDYVGQLTVNDGFVSSAPDTVLVRVVQAALPVVSIVATDGSASESGDTGTFTVSRSGQRPRIP